MAAKDNTVAKAGSGKKTGTPKQKGARKSVMTQKRKNALQSEAIAAKFKKLSVVILILLIFMWLAGWFLLNDGPSKTASWVCNETLLLTSKAGFNVANILVEGREYTDADAILALVNVRSGDPLFSFNPKEAKIQIEKIGWVKSAHVERRLPDTIYIRITERKPVALWHNKGELFLVDEGGALITQEGLGRFKDLIMVSGAGAPDKTAALMKMLEQEAELMKMVDHCEFVDERRWDLILSDDKRIKLPESEPDKAISHIIKVHGDNGFLSNKTIVDIDARYNDRLIVRTHLGKVQDYKDGVADAL